MSREEEGLDETEESILRFQMENEVTLKAARLGVEMDRFVHANDSPGKELIEAAIDSLHGAMIDLIETDLRSDAAVNLQVEARAMKRLIEFVRLTLETGREAIIDIEQNQPEDFGDGQEEN